MRINRLLNLSRKLKKSKLINRLTKFGRTKDKKAKPAPEANKRRSPAGRDNTESC